MRDGSPTVAICEANCDVGAALQLKAALMGGLFPNVTIAKQLPCRSRPQPKANLMADSSPFDVTTCPAIYFVKIKIFLQEGLSFFYLLR